MEVRTPDAGHEDGLVGLDDVAGRSAGDRGQTLARGRERRVLTVHRRRNRARPARIRINHTAPDRRALDQPELRRCLGRQSAPDWLTGRKDERWRAGRDLALRVTADLLELALDDRA